METKEAWLVGLGEPGRHTDSWEGAWALGQWWPGSGRYTEPTRHRQCVVGPADTVVAKVPSGTGRGGMWPPNPPCSLPIRSLRTQRVSPGFFDSPPENQGW